jgi:hypothetical protein
MFPSELCDLLHVPRPEPTRPDDAENAGWPGRLPSRPGLPANPSLAESARRGKVHMGGTKDHKHEHCHTRRDEGVPHDPTFAGLRVFPVSCFKNDLNFSRPAADGIEALRVRHGTRYLHGILAAILGVPKDEAQDECIMVLEGCSMTRTYAVRSDPPSSGPRRA